MKAKNNGSFVKSVKEIKPEWLQRRMDQFEQQFGLFVKASKRGTFISGVQVVSEYVGALDASDPSSAFPAVLACLRYYECLNNSRKSALSRFASVKFCARELHDKMVFLDLKSMNDISAQSLLGVSVGVALTRIYYLFNDPSIWATRDIPASCAVKHVSGAVKELAAFILLWWCAGPVKFTKKA